MELPEESGHKPVLEARRVSEGAVQRFKGSLRQVTPKPQAKQTQLAKEQERRDMTRTTALRRASAIANHCNLRAAAQAGSPPFQAAQSARTFMEAMPVSRDQSPF